MLVFDEIQKIPRWSETVKGLWDADRARNCPLRVVILGSAPLLMQSGLSESLAGRFETIRVAHWSFKEMAEAFDFDLPTYLYFGGYPGAARTIRDPERWRAYVLGALVEPNIERDILAMTRVDKPALLKRLFELGAVHSGQILSYTKMLGQTPGRRQHHDPGALSRPARPVPACWPGCRSTPISRSGGGLQAPKLNVLNTALMTAGSGYAFAEAQADRSFWRRIVESVVGAHLLNTAASGIRLYYWRDGSNEVDFVLQRGPGTVAIEVKSGARRPAPAGHGRVRTALQSPSLACGWRGRRAAQRVSHGARP